MKTKHTKGPWTACHSDEFGVQIVSMHEYDYALKVVTNVSSNEADAHLIAAEPEMLDLLKKFRIHAISESVRCELDLIIAKAEGEK